MTVCFQHLSTRCRRVLPSNHLAGFTCGSHVPRLVHLPRSKAARTDLRGRRRNVSAVAVSSLADIDPELPDYDMVCLGSLEVSSVALDCSKWTSADPSAFISAVDGGVTLYDTHPNEMLLGSWVNAWCLSDAARLPNARPPVLASTCRINLANQSSPLTRQQVVAALQAHLLKTGGVGGKGLCQVALDCPPEALLECQVALADGLKEALDTGFCSETVGVVGYGPKELEAFAAALGGGGGGPELVSNRVRYSLLDRSIETNGTLTCCRDLGLGVLASGALCEGRLAADSQGEPAVTGQQGDAAGLLKLLQLVGSLNGGKQKTATQVAVNWLVSSGVVPLVSTTNEDHAWEIAFAQGWRLDANQVELIRERAQMTVASQAKENTN